MRDRDGKLLEEKREGEEQEEKGGRCLSENNVGKNEGEERDRAWRQKYGQAGKLECEWVGKQGGMWALKQGGEIVSRRRRRGRHVSRQAGKQEER